MEIRIEKTNNPKEKLDPTKLVFGTEFTDHMFIMDYDEGKGWHDPRIVPYGPIELSPAAMVFHYAQETFEGLKAYRTLSGDIQLFRPYENARRLNRSNERMCIPPIDEEDFVGALKELIQLDKDWVPSEEGTSLYIRPFVFATDPYVGVRVSKSYRFMIILSPVGAYYASGLKPTHMYVEDYYARTVKGGTGEAKCGGNYASSLAAQEKAAKKGFEQILWLDSLEHKYIEEVGTSNIIFKIDGKFITPSLSGTILPGITRKSIIELLEHWGESVEERKITIDEIVEAYHEGKVEEVFGTGTAAVVSPIGSLNYMDEEMVFNDGVIGDYTQKIYDTLFGIQRGVIEDPFDWIIKI